MGKAITFWSLEGGGGSIFETIPHKWHLYSSIEYVVNKIIYIYLGRFIRKSAKIKSKIKKRKKYPPPKKKQLSWDLMINTNLNCIVLHGKGWNHALHYYFKHTVNEQSV